MQKQPNSYTNRAFLYGDGIFETMRMYKGEILLWDLHRDRIKNGLATLNMQQPNRFYFENLYTEIIAAAKTYQPEQPFSTDNLRVRVSFVRNFGGFYKPTDNRFQHFIDLHFLQTFPFPSYEKGLKTAICEDIILTYDKLSPCKTLSALRYVSAAQKIDNTNIQEVFLTNNNQRIAEASNANVFIYNNRIWQTPPITEGCIAGVMRQFLLANADNLGIKIIEQPIDKKQLYSSEEIFFSNVISGFRYVESIFGVENKQFVSTETAILTQKVKKMLIL
jgi:branched-chain amino acid aminotransferase